MKKIISILISVCLMLTLISPSVFAYEQTEINVSNIMRADETYMVTVKGTCEPDSKVSVYVTVQDDTKYVAIEQCDANSLGIFSKSFPMRAAGKYTAIVNNYKSNSRDEFDFELHTKTVLDDAIAAFKGAANETEMQSCITSYGAMFGFDTKYYNNTSKSAVATNMLAIKDILTKENIIEKFDESVLRAYIYDLSVSIDEVIEYYDSLTSIVSSPAGMYSDYKSMSATDKAAVQTIAFETPVTNISDLCEKFYMAIVEQKAKVCTNTEFDAFLEKYTDYLGLEGYSGISTIKKSTLLTALKVSDIPDNTAAFSQLYSSLLSGTGTTETPQTPSTGGSGGGGGTGNNLGVITESSGFEESEVINTPAPDTSVDISFSDLGSYVWAKDAITDLASKGVVNGKSEGMFAPGDYITREEFAKILVLAFGLYDDEAACEFTDAAPDRWSYKYIASSYAYGAINGYPDGSFGADKLITREEMAVMLYRVMSKQMKIEITTQTSVTLTDSEKISEYAKNSVILLNSTGIISGDETNKFNPQKNATRAEVCQMIYNSLNREGGRN